MSGSAPERQRALAILVLLLLAMGAFAASSARAADSTDPTGLAFQIDFTTEDDGVGADNACPTSHFISSTAGTVQVKTLATSASGWTATDVQNQTSSELQPSTFLIIAADGGVNDAGEQIAGRNAAGQLFDLQANYVTPAGTGCSGRPGIAVGQTVSYASTWSFVDTPPANAPVLKGPAVVVISRSSDNAYSEVVTFASESIVRPTPTPTTPTPTLPPPGSTPSDGSGPPAATPGCTTTSAITIAGITIQSGCFRLNTDKSWTALAGSTVRIGGVDVVVGAGDLTLHPQSQLVEGQVEVTLGTLPIYNGPISWKLGAPVEVVPNEPAKLKGLALSGSLEFEFGPQQSTATATVSAPKQFGGVTGSASLVLTQGGGLQIGAAKIAIAELDAGKVSIHDVSLAYAQTADGDEWAGQGAITLPGGTGFGGSMVFLNGDFHAAHVEFTNQIALGDTGIFLQQLRGDIKADPFTLGGGVTVSAGPNVLAKTAVEATGDVTVRFDAPADIRIDGTMKMVDTVNVGEAHVDLDTSGKFTFNGKASFELANTGFDGEVSGGLTKNAFEASGNVSIKVLKLSAGNAGGVISDRGLSACTTSRFGPTIGFGYHWGDSLPHPFGVTGSCNVSAYKSADSSLSSASLVETQTSGTFATASFLQASATTFRTTVRGGVDTEVFKITGPESAPLVTISGPHKTTIQSPLDGSGIAAGRIFLAEDPATRTTYVAIKHPAAGVWTITGETPADVIAAVQSARSAPPVSAQASVKTHPGSRRLTISAHFPPAPARVVRFFDRSGGHLRLLGTLRSAGSFSARAVDSFGTAHELVAEVDQGGVPASVTTVNHFQLAPIRTAGRIGTLTKTVSKHGFELRWKPAPRATSYLVSTRVGKTTALRRVSVSHVLEKVPRRPVEVSITPIDRYGRRGPTTSTTIRG